ncbi:MAG: FKBP-type peptidyl-prolyl cis-trans isomerase, partial [Elusimicrobia bacterium]|nr:FKBP-type peptidyl-prolyl cis-trans isomerase [Elusimicrobiota bacterium]
MLILSACGRGDQRVHDGSKVRFDYALTVDGRLFESSSKPLEIVAGAGMVIAGIEEALAGMRAGESKRALIPSDKAYGPVDPA